MFRFSRTSLSRMEGLDEKLKEAVIEGLKISSVDFGIAEYGGLRTAEEQYELFLEGSSTLDGYDKKSYHQTGKAVDIYAYVDGKASWEPEHLAQAALAIFQAGTKLGIKLEWGGFWKNPVDMPHIQRVD